MLHCGCWLTGSGLAGWPRGSGRSLFLRDSIMLHRAADSLDRPAFDYLDLIYSAHERGTKNMFCHAPVLHEKLSWHSYQRVAVNMMCLPGGKGMFGQPMTQSTRGLEAGRAIKHYELAISARMSANGPPSRAGRSN